jgi:hypothetical protein
MIPQIFFILSCVGLYHAYKKIDEDLSFNASGTYGRLDEDRRVYVVKNVIKGFYLALISLSTLYWVIPDIIRGTWNSTVLQTFASLYVSNDIVGLYTVKLHVSTRMHHMTAAVFLMAAWCADFQESTTAKMLALYTIFSALTFLVNLYLGLRFVFNVNSPGMTALKRYAKWSYVLGCGMNWVCQVVLAWNNSELWLNAYLMGLVFIVWDDIILLKWFFKN